MAIITDIVEFEGDDAGLFMRPVTENLLITQLGFEVMDDTVNKKYIYLKTEMDKITKLRIGCGFTATGNGLSVYRKLINPVDLQAQDSVCADVFDDTVFRKKMKRGVDVNDLTGTEIEKMLVDFITPVLTRDAMRILFLADTAHSDPNYNQMDGVYGKLADGVISDGIITQGALTAAAVNTTNIIQTLWAVVHGASRKLQQVPKNEKALYVTSPVYDGYVAWLQDNAYLQSARDLTVNGVGAVTFEGIELINLSIVTDYLETDFLTSSPATVRNPNRIIYSKKNNNILVLDTASNYNQIKFWYENLEDKNYYRARYMMQYEYKYPELVTVAGF